MLKASKIIARGQFLMLCCLYYNKNYRS